MEVNAELGQDERKPLRRHHHGIVAADEAELAAASALQVVVGDRAVALGPTEYRLLSFFMTHAERVYSRAQLLDRVWGGNVYVEERTVDVHIRRLREKLPVLNNAIETVKQFGYKLL